MKNVSYYDQYWNHEANAAEGWTPSSGQISGDEQRLFDKWLPKGARCLDYGCGDGLRYGRTLLDRGVVLRGFDISESAVSQARARGLDVSVLNADGSTTLADASMDAAICFEVLEHLQEPQLAAGELFRCLKPGGHALLSVPNAAYWTQRIEFLLTGFWCPGGSPLTSRRSPWRDPHIRFYNPRLIKRLAMSVGFEVEESFGEAFTLGALPLIWRRPRPRAIADWLSRPFGWLGRVAPSCFAMRLFLVVRKPDVK